MSRTLLLLLVLVSFVLAACGDDARGDSATPGPTQTRAAAALISPTPEVQPVRFPEDEAPHDMLTEWWYYTGHLFTSDGTRYGFEYVIFQAQRGAFAPYFAAHFAITDSAGGTFAFDEAFGQDAVRPAEQGFSLDLEGWTMRGALGEDHLVAAMEDGSFAIDLRVSATKPPALHNDIGYVEFGPAGGSYYYSRTRMEVDGTLAVAGQPLAVTGDAWMDHQWGNFISVGAGGWDWFAVQLGNGEDLTISLIFDDSHSVVMSYGTLVRSDGTTVHLASEDFVVNVTDEWTSLATGATYPARWTIELPGEGWSLDLVPSIPEQELVTTASTGVTYWEGEVIITGAIDGEPIDGLGYVELTGYAD